MQGIPIPLGAQLQWTTPPGSTITLYPGSLGCAFTANAPGITTITCSVVGGLGCVAGLSETYTFEIRNPCNSPADGVIDKEIKEDTFEAKKLPEDLEVRTYPNPAQSQVVVKLPAGFDFETGWMSVKSQNGVLVTEFQPNSSIQEINVSELAIGIYFLVVRDQNKYSVHKLNIQR
jgi:Secretion system C-terminal sorting domain